MSLAAGMSGRHHRRSAFLRHLQAAVVLCLRHLMHGHQASDSRRHRPEDGHHEHRQSTGSTHTHSLPLLASSKCGLPAAGRTVTEITDCGEGKHLDPRSSCPTSQPTPRHSCTLTLACPNPHPAPNSHTSTQRQNSEEGAANPQEKKTLL